MSNLLGDGAIIGAPRDKRILMLLILLRAIC